MSEDWIAALAEVLARRLLDPMESRLSLVEEYAIFGREVAERVRRETLAEIAAMPDHNTYLAELRAGTGLIIERLKRAEVEP